MSLWIILSTKILLWIHGETPRISCVWQLCTETALLLSLTQLFCRNHVISAWSTSHIHDFLELFLRFVIWETILALVHLNYLVCFSGGHPRLLFLISWETSVRKSTIRMEITAALVFGETLLINILLNVVAEVLAIIVLVVRRNTLLHLVYELSMHIIRVSNFVKLRIVLWFLLILLSLKVKSFECVGRNHLLSIQEVIWVSIDIRSWLVSICNREVATTVINLIEVPRYLLFGATID